MMLRSSAIAHLAILGVAGALFLSTPGAQAQDPGSTTPGIAGELERVASTTPEEKVEYVDAALVEMREAVKSVTRMLEAARRETNSAEKVQCLSNRLAQMRALLAVSEKSAIKMQGSLAGGQIELADHEFRKIAVALSRTRQLLFEAERCGIGETPGTGDTTVVVDGLTEDGDDFIGDYTDVDFVLEDISPFE